MTTIRQLVIDAFRETNIIAAGDVPDADIFDEGVRRMQNIVLSLYGTELGEPFRSVSYGTTGTLNSHGAAEDRAPEIQETFVPVNVCLLFNIDSPQTLYLDPNPRDGARFGVIDNGDSFDSHAVTIQANGRSIEDEPSVVLTTAGLNRQWFYRADLGNWMRVSDLTPDSESPFPSEFDDFLTTSLAMRLHPRFHGNATAPETLTVFNRMVTMFKARYRQKAETPVESGLTRLTSNGDYRYHGTSSGSRFNRGLI